ncbi:MAG: ankyrin repeat domain-containing protein [Anaerobacillus sp.]
MGKLLWFAPIFLLTVACNETNSKSNVSEPQVHVSAETETDSHVRGRDESFWTLLYENKSDEAFINDIEMLLSEGVAVDTLNTDGVTPIAYAVMEGNIRLVELFLQHGAVVYQHDEAGHEDEGKGTHQKNENLLEMAVQQGDDEIVDLLLKMGAHFEIGNENMLKHAVHQKDQDLIKTLLHNGYNPNLEFDGDRGTFTLLNYAIVEGDKDMIMLLLDAGANPNFAVENREENAVVTAVTSKQSTELVSLLLGRGGDANSSINGEPVLFEAIRQNNHSLVETFLAAGALPSSKKESEQAFELASDKIEELLQMYGW